MIIHVLAENTSSHENLGSEHGLSLYIETKNHRLLFDTGASSLFAENAEKLGIDLAGADMAVISHGHHDHGGGLRTFLSINQKAPVYFHRRAFEKHYGSRPGGLRAFIGLDEALLPNERLVFCGDHTVIDEELELFAGVPGNRLFPSGNADLFMESAEGILPDDFAHEQNLVIREDGKTLLIAGCAHRGIVNILDSFYAKYSSMPDEVIGGFHLCNPGRGLDEDPAIVDAVGKSLMDTGSRYHTCHCTGLASYHRLKTAMGDRIGYLSTGDQLVL